MVGVYTVLAFLFVACLAVGDVQVGGTSGSVSSSVQTEESLVLEGKTEDEPTQYRTGTVSTENNDDVGAAQGRGVYSSDREYTATSDDAVKRDNANPEGPETRGGGIAEVDGTEPGFMTRGSQNGVEGDAAKVLDSVAIGILSPDDGQGETVETRLNEHGGTEQRSTLETQEKDTTVSVTQWSDYDDLIPRDATIVDDAPSKATGVSERADVDNNGEQEDSFEEFGDSVAEDEYDEEYDDELEELVATAEEKLGSGRESREALRYFRMAAILGHPGAMATVGTLLSSGDSNRVERDLSSGIRFLRYASDHGQPDALAVLGFMYASGIADRFGIEKNVGKAILHWSLAAESGSIVAEVALGYRYYRGIGVRKSCSQASRYYRKAAKAIATDPRHFPTLQNFMSQRPPLPSGLTSKSRGRLRDSAFERIDAGDDGAEFDLIDLYRHSAAHGDSDAMATLGALQLFGGHGFEADEGLARADLEVAAGLGHGEANGILGHLALHRHDNMTALKYFHQSAAAEAAMGLYGLGMMFLHGVAVPKNPEKAAFYFAQAVEKKHADAALQVGLLHWKGQGVAQDYDKAFRYFEVGAAMGQLQCKLNLGLMYLEGMYPVEKPNCEYALQFLKGVAEAGEWESLTTLGWEHIDDGDAFGALYRFMQAAHVGIEVAQYNAAMLLEMSASRRPAGRFGASEDEEIDQLTSLSVSPELGHWDRDRMLQEALELYEMSAEQGHANSMLRAGHMAYTEAEDYERAAAAYEKGSIMKDAEASYSLGWMYARGHGVKQDRHLAVRYLDLAKSHSADAVLPATLAIVGARAMWWIGDKLMPLLGYHLDKEGPTSGASERLGDHSQANDMDWVGAGSDLLIVAALLGLLGVTLYTRRRRLADQHLHAD